MQIYKTHIYTTLEGFRPYHLVYVDECGCDKSFGFRRNVWSLFGVIPIQIAQFQREKRYQILHDAEG